ncbi:MAG: biotin-dependent carboxyltransferase family protein [Vicinamibacterales bacterium]
MSIAVVRPGMLTTVQDLGRQGLQHLGVPAGGPMDWWSHEAANRLVGNAPEAALLEVTLIGPELELLRNATAAVTGANFELSVSGRPVPMNQTFAVEAGDRLSFGRRVTGARGYVAFDGGIDVPAVMGSRATHLKAALGGHQGRALRRHDTLPLGAGGRTSAGASSPVADPPHIPLPSPTALRVIAGPEMPDAAIWQTVYTVSPQSDRMGYRLDGGAVQASGDHVSSAVAMGTVQVTPSGTCVLLMADRATSGGYARAATVITADLPRAGQLAPGDALRFVPVSFDEARAALQQMRARLPGSAA